MRVPAPAPSPFMLPAHLGRQQVVELGCEIELDALPGPGKGHPSNQQHEQDEVGEGGCEIHHLEKRARWDGRGPSTQLCLPEPSSQTPAFSTAGGPESGPATILDMSPALSVTGPVFVPPLPRPPQSHFYYFPWHRLAPLVVSLSVLCLACAPVNHLTPPNFLKSATSLSISSSALVAAMVVPPL